MALPALLGSLAAPLATAGLGALASRFLGNNQANVLTGSPRRLQEIPRMSPAQEQLISSLIPLAQQRLQAAPPSFEPIAQAARRRFETQTVPGILERLTGMGTAGGGVRSGALGQLLGSAGADLESQLAQLQSEYGLRQQTMGLNLLQPALTPTFDRIEVPGSPGLLGSLAPTLGRVGVESLADTLRSLMSRSEQPSYQAPLQQPVQAQQQPMDLARIAALVRLLQGR